MNSESPSQPQAFLWSYSETNPKKPSLLFNNSTTWVHSESLLPQTELNFPLFRAGWPQFYDLSIPPACTSVYTSISHESV
jgi:hypothetical protein